MTTATAGRFLLKREFIFFTFECRNCVKLFRASYHLLFRSPTRDRVWKATGLQSRTIGLKTCSHEPTALISKRRYEKLAITVHGWCTIYQVNSKSRSTSQRAQQ